MAATTGFLGTNLVRDLANVIYGIGTLTAGQVLAVNGAGTTIESVSPAGLGNEVCVPGDYASVNAALTAGEKNICVLSTYVGTETADWPVSDGVSIRGQTQISTNVDLGGNDVHINALAGTVYSTGTITLTDADATVTGAGTAFLANVSAGQTLKVGCEYLTVASITNDTTLELATAYNGTTTAGLSYEVFSPINFHIRDLHFTGGNITTTPFLDCTAAGDQVIIERCTFSNFQLSERLIEFSLRGIRPQIYSCRINDCTFSPEHYCVAATPEVCALVVRDTHIRNIEGGRGFLGEGIFCHFDNCSVTNALRGYSLDVSGSTYAHRASLTSCLADRCVDVGFETGGDDSHVVFTGCTAKNGDGFAARGGAGVSQYEALVYLGCLADNCTGSGFGLGQHSASYTRCTAINNTDSGFFFSAATSFNRGRVSITSCVSSGNGAHGIHVEATDNTKLIIGDCQLEDNTGDAIVLSGTKTTVDNCDISGSATNGVIQSDIGTGNHTIVRGCRIEGFTNAVNDAGSHVVVTDVF